MNAVKVFAPATIGNIGPGFDTLGLAIKGLGDTIEAEEIPGDELIIQNIDNADHDITRNPSKNTAGIAANEVLKILKLNTGISLRINKGLPSGSGLGSSAASAVGGACAVNILLGKKLNDEQLLQAAMSGEYSVSGGYFADNVAPAIYGGATLTRSLDPLHVTHLGNISELIIILAIPNVQILTRESRQVIPKNVDFTDCIHNMANTASITAAFCKNDYNLLKDNLFDQIIEPIRAKFIPGFGDVKSAAMNAGAHGMTISGSGPTVFAITNNNQDAMSIEKSMKNAFEKHDIKCTTMITTSSETGVKEI